jgi:hypothetical protein
MYRVCRGYTVLYIPSFILSNYSVPIAFHGSTTVAKYLIKHYERNVIEPTYSTAVVKILLDSRTWCCNAILIWYGNKNNVNGFGGSTTSHRLTS